MEGTESSLQTEHEDLSEVLKEADVLYITRIQKERFASQEVWRASLLNRLGSLLLHDGSLVAVISRC